MKTCSFIPVILKSHFFCTKVKCPNCLTRIINAVTENNFFEEINFFAYQKKKKNSPQALLPPIEQMSDAILSGKCGIAVVPDLEEWFDSVLRKGAIYKLHKEGINNNLLLVYSSE